MKKNDTIDFKSLERLSKMQKDLLSSVYKDFYGTDMPGAEMKDGIGTGDISSASAAAGENQTETASATQAVQPETAPEPETDPMDDLNELVGLTKIKHDVKELTAFIKLQQMREKEGLKPAPTSMHLVFTGNPGTGKTTVARIIGRLYKQIGALSKGQLIEVDRSGLVAGYVGQTALKTQDKIKQALGGVLFIDEAYSLSKREDTFGEEAIDTILKAMEDHRKDLCVIVAGYTEPMKKFIESNPGLKSRFNKYIEFPDYTVDELEEIFYMNCKKYDYKVADDAKNRIRTMILGRKMAKLENFANAREVRNMFEDIIVNQARRVVAMENPTQDDLMTITCEDLVDTELQKIEEEEGLPGEFPVPDGVLEFGEEAPEEPEAENAAGAEETPTEVDINIEHSPARYTEKEAEE